MKKRARPGDRSGARSGAKSGPKSGARPVAKGRKDAAGGRKPGASEARASQQDKATIRRLRADLARAERRIEELQASADTDFLLGIPNRRGFEHELARAIAYIKRYQASGALILLDVDRLKPINDSFGHAAGDRVLKAITDVLTRQVRASDVVGRLGGDEFGLLLWNLTETDARAKAATLEADIDNLTFAFGGESVTAGASAGVAILGPHSESGRALEEADSAMYVRKAQRRHETDQETNDVRVRSDRRAPRRIS
jgi:diguanylate cyclase (GGDEF)-like protein